MTGKMQESFRVGG